MWNVIVKCTEGWRNIGGYHIILADLDEILSRFTRIQAVLWTLYKWYSTITWEKFYPGKAGFLFCTAKILLCRDEIFPCNRLPGWKSNLTHAFKKKKEKENVNKSNCITLQVWHLILPCSGRVKSVPPERLEISSRQTRIM